jgi:pyridoxamine 5'-phosphate oxidase
MIKIKGINKSKPYKIFLDYYNLALSKEQHDIEAVSISSFNKSLNEVQSRYVNLKYILDDEWIFFSNYKSKKADSFKEHAQISALFYWSNINTQIRIKALIKKTSKEFSDKHFFERCNKKNAIAISSRQSESVSSYKEVIKNYELALNNKSSFTLRPNYWGGYSFVPYYFEFWEGHKSRINKRNVFEKFDDSWEHSLLQP